MSDTPCVGFACHYQCQIFLPVTLHGCFSSLLFQNDKYLKQVNTRVPPDSHESGGKSGEVWRSEEERRRGERRWRWAFFCPYMRIPFSWPAIWMTSYCCFHGCLFCPSGLSFFHSLKMQWYIFWKCSAVLLDTRCTGISTNAKLVWLRGKKISISFHVEKVSKSHFLISSYIMWNNWVFLKIDLMPFAWSCQPPPPFKIN